MSLFIILMIVCKSALNLIKLAKNMGINFLLFLNLIINNIGKHFFAVFLNIFAAIIVLLIEKGIFC